MAGSTLRYTDSICAWLDKHAGHTKGPGSAKASKLFYSREDAVRALQRSSQQPVAEPQSLSTMNGTLYSVCAVVAVDVQILAIYNQIYRIYQLRVYGPEATDTTYLVSVLRL